MSRVQGAVTPDSRPDDVAWGHASGWAQLYGQRRTVSCVVLGLETAGGLAQMFDSLSDSLTEAGYPWEVLMIDVGARPHLSALLATWCERPGFRRIALPSGATGAAALTLGLEKSRGDGVLLMEARAGELTLPIPDMVSRWSDGVEIVRSRWLEPDEPGRDGRGPPGPAARPASQPGLALGQLLDEEAVFLDRRAVDMLIRGA